MEKRSEVRVTKTPAKKPVTLEEFQQEKITRREALPRIGITTGAGLFMMFGIDDLARLAARKLTETRAFGEVGETVAREFKDAGVAFANYPPSGASVTPSGLPSFCYPQPNPYHVVKCKCSNYPETDADACLQCCADRYDSTGIWPNPDLYASCVNYDCNDLDHA
jgi:hypothetical protein